MGVSMGDSDPQRTIKQGDTVLVHTPGESCDGDTGTVVSVNPKDGFVHVAVDLVREGHRWHFSERELEVTKTAQQEGE